ncbi:MAG TPA: serine/threonine-protein kinase [Pirellulales bacterium]|nr:serine/threonine-protein kinase [Pirellulales bacterium]
MEKSVFIRCALASGLLTQAEIDEAVNELDREAPAAKRSFSDERIAGKLVEMCRLNRWQAEQLRAGRTKFNLGPYQIIDSIGQGGMGQVFKAEHTIMGRVVAVKVLPRSRSTPEAIVNFTREIRAQAQLDHENLVRAFDAGHDGNVHFLVTEYVPGTDLRRLIRVQGRLSMATAASIITQAARGLEHAHGRGLIHRDVKPGNLLVTPDGRCKVSDLGLAGYFNESEQTDVYGGKVVGTADYLAPEQITTPDKLTPASDVYSLGCTLYYAVTGKVPFPGGSPRDKARAHCNLPPLDPRRLNPELSDDFVEVIADMMAKKPDQRVANGPEVGARLAAWVGSSLPGAVEEGSFSGSLPPAAFPGGPGFPGGPAFPGGQSRGGPSPMSDTEPYFLVTPTQEPGQTESPSQQSLGTNAMSGGIDETLPGFRPDDSLSSPMHRMAMRSRSWREQWRRLPDPLRLWLVAGASAVVGGIVALTLHAMLFGS